MGGRMIRQLQDDELVSKVMSRWPEEEDAFLIFMMPTVNVEVGTEITSLDDLDEDEVTEVTEMTDLNPDEEDYEDEESVIDDDHKEEGYGYKDLPVIAGEQPTKDLFEEEEDEEEDEVEVLEDDDEDEEEEEDEDEEEDEEEEEED